MSNESGTACICDPCWGDHSVYVAKDSRVIDLYGRRYVVEVKINPKHQSVTVICAPGIARIAPMLADKLLEENGWRRGGGGSHSWGGSEGFGPVDMSTGNGRNYTTQCGNGGRW